MPFNGQNDKRESCSPRVTGQTEEVLAAKGGQTDSLSFEFFYCFLSQFLHSHLAFATVNKARPLKAELWNYSITLLRQQ